MIIDLHSYPYSPEAEKALELVGKGTPYRCFLDGKEIKQVWYVDTDAGIVKTMDVFGDDKTYHRYSLDGEKLAALLGSGRDIDAPFDKAISETLRGNVELVIG